MSKRLAMLEKMTAAGSTDPFAWYGLALEYRTLGRIDEAIQTFHTLRDRDPSYVPMYLMAAQTLDRAGRRDEARTWIGQGIAQAKAKGDDHALSELSSLLAELGSLSRASRERPEGRREGRGTMAIAIHTRTIERLRDTLRESGQRPSMVLSGAYETLARSGLLSLEEQMAIARVEPLGEIMYLMMAADGHVADVERDVLRGAIRGLTDDGVRSGTLKVMLERFERDALAYGRDARLAELTSLLVDDRAGAEGAFVLAAAIAFADGEIRPEENDVINALASRLAISEDRANQLLDTLEEDASGG